MRIIPPPAKYYFSLSLQSKTLRPRGYIPKLTCPNLASSQTHLAGQLKSLSQGGKNAKILSVEAVRKFIISSYEELKRVTWPSKKDTIRLTGYVIGVSFGVGLFVMFADLIFTQLLTLLVTK